MNEVKNAGHGYLCCSGLHSTFTSLFPLDLSGLPLSYHDRFPGWSMAIQFRYCLRFNVKSANQSAQEIFGEPLLRLEV